MTRVLDPAGEQQLVVITGLLQEVHGDLQEIFQYYALLGNVQVVADRLTMELPQFGKLAYDLHIGQDNRSLSAVEDAFYVLSDRTQLAVARAAAFTSLGGVLTADPDVSAVASAMAAALGPEVIVPEQFAEALVRLACVRYRWGAVKHDYDWDNSFDSSDEEDYEIDDDDDDGFLGAGRPMRVTGNSLRSAEADQALLAGRRPAPAEYAMPSDADDLVTIVRVFIQHEVLRFARRNRLAGSPLGHRRAGLKPPQDPGWQMLPRASMLAE
eukprot:gene11560-11703_t